MYQDGWILLGSLGLIKEVSVVGPPTIYKKCWLNEPSHDLNKQAQKRKRMRGHMTHGKYMKH